MRKAVHGHRQVVGPAVVLRGSVVVAGAARYKGYRYPIEVIGHAVWLYHRFALSLRDVEELMLARGVVVSYETIRSWCAKFGPDYANQLRRRRPRPGDKWHLDEVFVKINGTIHYLWRAVTSTATCSTSSRSRAATPQQPSGSSANCSRACSMRARDRHRPARQLSGRSPRGFAVGDASPLEVPQQPGRELPSADQNPGAGDETLRLTWACPTVPVCVHHIRQHFGPHRHLISAPQWRTQMTNRFAVWDEITAAAAA